MSRVRQTDRRLIKFITFANEGVTQTSGTLGEQPSFVITTASNQPQLTYPLKKEESNLINIGYDFDGVFHFNVTPLTCYADNKCSRHPVDKNKKPTHKFTGLDKIEFNNGLINYISKNNSTTNNYIISSNQNIFYNINLLLKSYDNNPFVGIEYAQDKLEVIRKLKLKQYWDDSNYHLYRILDAKDKTDLPTNLVKVFPENIHSIYDKRHDNLPAITQITNNPHTVTLSMDKDDLIRVFTYNIYYKLQIGTREAELNNIALVLANAVDANYDFICLQESLYGIQDLFNHFGISSTNLGNYKEIPLKTLILENKQQEQQYTYFNHEKYILVTGCIGNLDVRDIKKERYNRPFTLLCLQDKINSNSKIILINAHFPHAHKQTNTRIASYIDMFIDACQSRDTIKDYLATGARVIMAGDFNRVIRGTTEMKPHDNSHYGLALFKGLDGYKRPTILYNIMPNEDAFEMVTCPGKMQGHIDAVLDSWGLQYKHAYPNVTRPASDHIPVVVSLLKGNYGLP